MNAVQDNAQQSIRRIGVVGYGFVGRATGEALSEVVDARFHDPVVEGSSPLDELAQWADALFVCVPTPRGPDGAADTSAVFAVMADLARLGVNAPVILKSTVPPGTCAALSERFPSLGLVFSPEFLRERHHLEDARAPARIVLGWTTRSQDKRAVLDLHERRFPRVPLIEMCAAEAELLKYASNALFGIKVSFANEMHELATRLGLDWEQVRQALVLDPRIGDGHLRVPGPDGHPGFGGTCLPKDMAGLLAVAEAADVPLEVVAAALRANARHRQGRP